MEFISCPNCGVNVLEMENKIKELIEKYDVKITEEPLNYFQWVEIVGELKSLLELYQSQQEVAPESK
mgnify:CR=1 FL=1